MSESNIKFGRFIKSSPYPSNSKLPKENIARNSKTSMIAEKIMIITPINLPMILNNTLTTVPITSNRSCKPEVAFLPFF